MIIKQDFGEVSGGEINFEEPITTNQYTLTVNAPANSYIIYSSLSARQTSSYTAEGDVTISGTNVEVIKDTANNSTSSWGAWYMKTRQIIVFVPTAQSVLFTGISGTGNIYSGIRPIATIITNQ